ncbi:aspartic proteinase CDR1-like [Prosopis cineraria]|uniref:aspartic proteinase CDR1-like n=1 Tax=Prosopis cineraria TaxID=364024 RepID=UPI0024109A15|nr:aspartic proteinase CDR1-like [Prosopis cineraria]
MAFTTKIQPLYSVLTFLLLLHILIRLPSKSTANTGLTANLMPRDCPSSPFYNPSKTHFNRLHDAFERSFKRIHHFKSILSTAESKIQTQILPGGGEFIMNISIGTPPFEVLGIADTGSDLSWTQCLPCTECFKQNIPLFDPRKSSTYKKLTCRSSSCQALDRPPQCVGEQNICVYTYSYGDGSHTTGDLSSETFTLGIENKVPLRNIVFGCGHVNAGTFDASQSGLIGLGGGRLSFVSQLDESVGKKFSYCLVPSTSSTASNNVSGKISFGDDALVSGSGAVTTPLVTRDPSTFYYLTLEAISVGNKRIPYKGSTTLVPANEIIIDSGTTLTFLPIEFYDDVEKAVVKAVNETLAKDPNNVFGLCYNASSGDSLRLPVLTAHFNGGDVKLQPLNTFVQVDEGLICFSMVGTPDAAIYGNLAQMNFLVGYDLGARTVSFSPTDCTQQ